jgi:hypothetical protein
MRTIATALFTLTLALCATAAAQDRPRAQRDQAPDINYIFEDEGVLGGRDSAEGSNVLHVPRGRRVSLIRPRVHFVPEMLKSVERL